MSAARQFALALVAAQSGSAVAASVVTAIAGAVGVAVGAIITAYTSFRLAELRASHEYDIRRAEVLDRRADERRQFQRITLMALQDALASFVRATGQAHFSDSIHHRDTGEPWNRHRLGKKLSNRLLLHNTEVLKLSARVEDQGLRELVDHLRTVMNRVTTAEDEGTAKASFQRSMQQYEAVVERVSELFREI